MVFFQSVITAAERLRHQVTYLMSVYFSRLGREERCGGEDCIGERQRQKEPTNEVRAPVYIAWVNRRIDGSVVGDGPKGFATP